MSFFIAVALFVSVICCSEPDSPRSPSAPTIFLCVASPVVAAGRVVPVIIIPSQVQLLLVCCFPGKENSYLSLSQFCFKHHLWEEQHLLVKGCMGRMLWLCPPRPSPSKQRLGGHLTGLGAAGTSCGRWHGASHGHPATPCPPSAFQAGLIWAGHALEALLKLMLLTELVNCF